MQPSRIITDYRLSEKRSIFDDEMYSTICVEWAVGHLVLVWSKSIHFWWRYARKTIFTFSFPVTLTLTFRPKVCSSSYSCPVLCFHCGSLSYFEKIGGTGRTDRRTDGQTDGVQCLMQCLMRPPLYRGTHNNMVSLGNNHMRFPSNLGRITYLLRDTLSPFSPMYFRCRPLAEERPAISM